MTDEELAKAYAKDSTHSYKDFLVDIDDKNVLEEAIEEAYLAGLEVGRPQWHDLRKDPNDLPKDYGSVWTNKGGACHDKDGWYDDYGWVHGVIAWCKPKFEEEQNE